MSNIGIYNVHEDTIEQAPVEADTWYAIYTEQDGIITEIDSIPESQFAFHMCLLWVLIFTAGFTTGFLVSFIF